jgi:DNA-binding IclR family transcriptional regulator
MARLRAHQDATSSSARDVFSALRLVLEGSEPLTIAEISRRLNISNNKAYRAVTTLERAEYLGRNPSTGAFAIGSVAERLVYTAFQNLHIRSAMIPYLRQIATSAEETTSLIVRVGWYGVRVANIEGPGHVVARADRLGSATMLHEDAAGLAIMSSFSDSEIGNFFQFIKTKQHRSKMVISEKALKKRVGAARADKVVIFGGEQADAIGIPLRNSLGMALAAVSIEAPKGRAISLERDPLLPDWLITAAEAERVLHSAPDKFVNPYAHLNPNEIVFAAR